MPFALPYLRLSLLVRAIRSTAWDTKTWPIVKHELAKALRMRAVIARAGWWN